MTLRTELDRYYRARFASTTAKLRSELPGQTSPALAPAPVGDAIARLERADLASPTELDFMLTMGMLV